MKLEIGKTYVDGNGREQKIMGLAKTEPYKGAPVYWSLSGFWYAEDGHHLIYWPHNGGLARIGNDHRDLLKVAQAPKASMKDLVEG